MGGEFQAIRPVKGIHHGLCQEHIFFCTGTKCLPFFLLLIISSGCRSGKYLHIYSQVYKLGCNYCFPLVESAQNEGHEVMICHSLYLPYQSECFDTVLSIAGEFCYCQCLYVRTLKGLKHLVSSRFGFFSVTNRIFGVL